jgi:hypothetical protein
MRRVIASVWLLVACAPAGAEATDGDIFPAHALRAGGIHFHTAYSDGAPHSRPPQAYQAGRAAGMEFMAVTEHSEWLSLPVEADEDCLNPTVRLATDCLITTPDGMRKWDAQAEAAAAESTESFLGLRGFEWSSPYQGHVVVLGSRNYSDAIRDGGATMHGFYSWLGRDPALGGGSDGVGIFAHPGREAAKFESLRYDPSVDAQIVGAEVFNRGRDREYFIGGLALALDNGWHAGAIGSADDHGPNWGRTDRARTVLLVPDGTPWTEATVVDALRARRFYATHKHSLQLRFSAAGAEMGGRLAGTPGAEVSLDVDVFDPDPGTSPVTGVEVYTNGAAVVTAVENPSPGERMTLSVPSLFPAAGERWYIVRVLTADGRNAFSSPIWLRAS